MSISVVETWVETPLKRFVDDARILIVLLLQPSGQVLGQYGFGRAVDVMSACALAAAIHASSSEMGKRLDGKPFAGLHHAGRDRQIFLAPVPTAQGDLLVLAVFDQESSLGLVTLYFGELRERLAAAVPAPVETPAALTANFEHDLNRNLAVLFGRA